MDDVNQSLTFLANGGFETAITADGGQLTVGLELVLVEEATPFL
jgi:hypothetical protein